MSSSAAGSSASTSKMSPAAILSSSKRVLKTGSGQYNPTQSSVLFDEEFEDNLPSVSICEGLAHINILVFSLLRL